jgi:hypothetical protein
MIEPRLAEASRWRSRLLVLLTLLAAANLAVLVIRVVSLYHGSVWLQMPNAEAMNVYALWQLRNGLPLYESIGQPYIPFSPYNFLFSYSYGAFLALLRMSGPEISFWARIPTLASACLGAWILYRTTVRLSRRLLGTADRPTIALLSGISWLGCGIVGWSSLAVRPDVTAAMITIAAVSVTLLAIDRERTSWRLMIVVGLLFAAAWSFKHAYIASFVGTAAYLAVVRRRVADLAALIVPYAMVIAVALSLGSPGYYFTIFGVQSQDPIRIHEAQFWLRAGLLPNLLVWTVPALSALDLFRRWRRDRVRPPDACLLLIVVTGCVSGFTLLIIGKLGASEHYLIEASVLGTVWSGVALSAWRTRAAGARRLRLAAWAVVPMLIFVLSILTRVDLVRNTIGIRARGDWLVPGARVSWRVGKRSRSGWRSCRRRSTSTIRRLRSRGFQTEDSSPRPSSSSSPSCTRKGSAGWGWRR